MKLTLRDYQDKAVSDVRQSYIDGYRAPVLQLETGAGKTVCFSDISERMASLGKSAMILVHRIELVKQTSRTLNQFGVDHGIINPKFTPNTRKRIQIASVQTLIRRLDRYKAPDLIITDECHHSLANSYLKIYEKYKQSRLLGVTATPERPDGKGLDKVYDKLITGPSMRELINRGHLSDFKVFAPPAGVDFSNVGVKYGEFDNEEIVRRVDKRSITGCAIEHYKRICPGVPAIAFCSSVKHAQHVADQFIQAGIPAKSIYSGMGDELRYGAIRDLELGRIKILTSCDIVSEGTDVPVVAAAILLRPTMSLIVYMQQGGRALRAYPGKQWSYIIDHVGNVMRHGFPDDERQWSLEGNAGNKKKQEAETVAPKQCPSCYCCHKSTMKSCPECGHVYIIIDRSPKEVNGTLVELNRDFEKEEKEKAKEEKEYIKKQKAKARGYSMSKAQTLEQLEELAQELGYKPGWAKHIFEARQKKRKVIV